MKIVTILKKIYTGLAEAGNKLSFVSILAVNSFVFYRNYNAHEIRMI